MNAKAKLKQLEKLHRKTQPPEINVNLVWDMTEEEKANCRERAKNDNDYIFVSLDWGDNVG